MRHVPVAIAFGRLHQQGVKLIEQRFIRRQMLVKELLRGIVIRRRGKKLVPRKDAARVSIRNKYGLPAGIEQNCVGGFRADSLEGQKLRAGARGAQGKERVQRAAVRLFDPVGKIVKGPGLLPVKTRRTNHLLQFAQGAWRKVRHASRPALRRFFKAKAAFRQVVFWVRIAPQITSQRVRAGHHPCGPKLSRSVA